MTAGGYTQHVRLTSAMRLHPAYYAAWGCRRALAADRPPDGSEPWWPDHGATDIVADRVVARRAESELAR